MISAASPSTDRVVIVKATIKDMIQDGSKTFTVKAIRREVKRNGQDLTSQAICQALRTLPGLEQYGNISKYWKLEGDL